MRFGPCLVIFFSYQFTLSKIQNRKTLRFKNEPVFFPFSFLPTSAQVAARCLLLAGESVVFLCKPMMSSFVLTSDQILVPKIHHCTHQSILFPFANSILHVETLAVSVMHFLSVPHCHHHIEIATHRNISLNIISERCIYCNQIPAGWVILRFSSGGFGGFCSSTETRDIFKHKFSTTWPRTLRGEVPAFPCPSVLPLRWLYSTAAPCHPHTSRPTRFAAAAGSQPVSP